MPKTKSQKQVLATIGANIRRERIAFGITQEKLSEKADLNVRTLQKIEAGQLDILITTFVRLQNALACPWDKLLPQKTKTPV